MQDGAVRFTGTRSRTGSVWKVGVAESAGRELSRRQPGGH